MTSRRAPTDRQAQDAFVTLLRAADAARAVLDATVAPHGITAQQYNVLRILRGAEPEGLPTLGIAGRMIERAPGITRIIDRLEARGLVRRERRDGDRRCVHCRITGSGLEILGRLDQPVRQANRRALAPLNNPDLSTITELLARVANRSPRL